MFLLLCLRIQCQIEGHKDLSLCFLLRFLLDLLDVQIVVFHGTSQDSLDFFAFFIGV